VPLVLTTSPSVASKLVNPFLQLDLYNGSAWLVLDMFHLDKLYIDVPGLGWVRQESTSFYPPGRLIDKQLVDSVKADGTL
jgi:hypothetical protein